MRPSIQPDTGFPNGKYDLSIVNVTVASLAVNPGPAPRSLKLAITTTRAPSAVVLSSKATLEATGALPDRPRTASVTSDVVASRCSGTTNVVTYVAPRTGAVERV